MFQELWVGHGVKKIRVLLLQRLEHGREVGVTSETQNGNEDIQDDEGQVGAQEVKQLGEANDGNVDEHGENDSNDAQIERNKKSMHVDW